MNRTVGLFTALCVAAGLIVAGVAMWSVPAALIVAGAAVAALALAVGVNLAEPSADAHSPPQRRQ